MIQFLKYHALGNDYFVYKTEKPDEEAPQWTKEQIQRICHRNYGLGSDGILVCGKETNPDLFTLKIFNPDGSEAEKSGNGLRIFARSLWDRKWVGNQPFQIKTLGGLVTAQVHEFGEEVTVEMGKVSFHSDVIPVNGPSREVIKENLEIDGEQFTFCAATIGNPHCVISMKSVNEADARRIGPKIESHILFPNRTNVQFLEVLNRNQIRIEIWERGAGYTLASGSSSSAAACVAKRLGLCDSQIEVHMPGGIINITIQDDYEVVMRGSVTKIGEFTLDPECFNFQAVE